MAQQELEPFFFRSGQEQLFGCYHAPGRGPKSAARKTAVLLVHPMDQENIRSHRAYRRLATQLSGLGYPVLRFDLYACGDSEDECELGSIHRWVEDVAAALKELQRRSGLSSICIIGMRLGATFAATAAVEHGGLRGLVLWEPVLSGALFIEDLRSAHDKMIRTFLSKPRSTTPDEAGLDIMGFPFPDRLLAEFKEMGLGQLEGSPAEDVLLLDQGTDYSALAGGLEATETRLTHKSVAGPRIWEEDPSAGLIPQEALKAIESWVAETMP